MGPPVMSGKVHNLAEKSFTSPTFCNVCGNFIWGLHKQGLKCSDCKFTCHKSCKDQAPLDCGTTKYRSHMRGCVGQKAVANDSLVVFGKPLEQVMNLPTHAGRKIPIVMELAIHHIQTHGLQSEGIFRLSAQTSVVEQVILQSNHGIEVDFENIGDSVNVAAQVLKQFLRDLPEPLFPFAFYSKILASQEMTLPSRMEMLKSLVHSLPSVNFRCLYSLLSLLQQVASFEQENKMTLNNLVTMFAPALLRPTMDSTMALLQDNGRQFGVLKLILENFTEIFEP